ncbi:MAG TPA: hypothetical protein VKR06_46195 [Ktedonosporobacter sp.]|nr:hypothetical protein [Ktedonosporobacter sp.]
MAVITIPRVFGGTIILGTTPPVQFVVRGRDGNTVVVGRDGKAVATGRDGSTVVKGA